MAKSRRKALPAPEVTEATITSHEQPAATSAHVAPENGHGHQHTPPMTASGGSDTVREDGHAAHHAPHREHGSHADAVGKQPPVIQSGITFARNDLLAGVRQGEGFRLIGGRKVRDGIIVFAEKPSPEVIATMNAASFKWQPADRMWTYPIRPESAWEDRAHTEQTFETVSKAIRTERGITHGYGGPE